MPLMSDLPVAASPLLTRPALRAIEAAAQSAKPQPPLMVRAGTAAAEWALALTLIAQIRF
jgi:hypothetical protein